eukprot:gene3353-3842_t
MEFISEDFNSEQIWKINSKESYALVEFEKEGSVQRLLIEKDQQELCGRRLLIKPRKLHSEPSIVEERKDKERKISKEGNDIWYCQKNAVDNALDVCKNVSSQMVALVDALQLTDEDLKLRKTVCKLLQGIFEEAYSNCKVAAFGSSVNQLGCKGCDLDLTIISTDLDTMLNQKPQLQPQVEKRKEGCESNASCITNSSASTVDDNIMEIGEILRRFLPGCKNVFPLTNAHCPIIKFHHKHSGLNCDLSINNRLAVANSELLHMYCKIDDRVRPLAYSLRIWAKSKGIAGKGAMQLTQYALVLMLISYLQQCKPPVLPCLQEDKSNDKKRNDESKIDGWDCWFEKDINSLNENRNLSSAGELLFGFFRHFLAFDYKSNIISMKATTILPRGLLRDEFVKLGVEDKFKYGPVCIIDPFELSHNVAQNITKDGLENFKAELKNAISILQRTFSSNNGNDNTVENPKCDLRDLFEVKRTKKDGRKKRKIRCLFDVYADMEESTTCKDISMNCKDVVLGVLQDDLKFQCKINDEDDAMNTVIDIQATGSNMSLEKEESVEGTLQETVLAASQEAVRKRKIQEDEIGELNQPAKKLSKISKELDTSIVQNSTSTNQTSVQIYATAWANTWTHRRQQRRILEGLKDGQIRSDTSLPVSVAASQCTSADSGVFVPNESDAKQAMNTSSASMEGIESKDTNETPASSSRVDNKDTIVAKGPVIRCEIKIFRATADESRCRIAVEMKEARCLNDFHTFFAFFKKQIVHKLKA